MSLLRSPWSAPPSRGLRCHACLAGFSPLNFLPEYIPFFLEYLAEESVLGPIEEGLKRGSPQRGRLNTSRGDPAWLPRLSLQPPHQPHFLRSVIDQLGLADLSFPKMGQLTSRMKYRVAGEGGTGGVSRERRPKALEQMTLGGSQTWGDNYKPQGTQGASGTTLAAEG